tara:strand:+ start:293 stop:820 length:528 start_codon:yes stop_codon:yes gene_type:complete
MAKKKKESKEIKPITKTKKANELIQNTIDNKEKLSELDIASVIIPDDAIIQIPISGNFRKAIEDTLNFILAPMQADEIVATMHKIKANFRDEEGKLLPEDKITIIDKSVWTLMSLLSEINLQAADQGKTVAVKETVKESLTNVLNNMNEQTMEAVIDDVRDFSNKEFGEDISTSS